MARAFCVVCTINKGEVTSDTRSHDIDPTHLVFSRYVDLTLSRAFLTFFFGANFQFFIPPGGKDLPISSPLFRVISAAPNFSAPRFCLCRTRVQKYVLLVACRNTYLILCSNVQYCWFVRITDSCTSYSPRNSFTIKAASTPIT